MRRFFLIALIVAVGVAGAVVAARLGSGEPTAQSDPATTYVKTDTTGRESTCVVNAEYELCSSVGWDGITEPCGRPPYPACKPGRLFVDGKGQR